MTAPTRPSPARRAVRRARRLARELAPATARRPPVNPLQRYFENNRGQSIFKWEHYFEIYHRHLAAYRDRPVTVVEFGVLDGGSLQMWRDYFGEKARIVGVDIDPTCADLGGDHAEIVIGNQSDRAFLRRLAERVGPIDVVIEDGGHRMDQQIATFEEMWPVLREVGVMLVEDVHTSYWPKYGGGLRDPGTFVEYTKRLVDQLNAWHATDEDDLEVDEFTRTCTGLHAYDSVFVFDKGRRVAPSARKTGVTRSGE